MISVIICAAGKGVRAGFSQNKLLQELDGLPVLCRTLSVFASLLEVDEILVTHSDADELAFRPHISPIEKARLVLGGQTRAESVWNALRQVKGEIVLVHDGARPFVTEQTVRDCIQSVAQFGSGICALPATDTTVLAKEGSIVSAPNRSEVFTVQTPQGFLTEQLRSAYERAFAEGKEAQFTDDSGIFATYVAPPRLFLGSRENKKLTFSEDFRPVERVGFGVDTHAFGRAQDFIVLGGVKIPSHSGLIAHSDGDVLAHALMDALLSGAGLRDIGYYFPDTEEKYKGADSMQLLKEVVSLIGEQGFQVQNVSISVLAEKPRLSPYIESMKASLSSALALPLSAIGLGAGTNEKLGYVGEGKGITVYCSTLLKRR